VKVLQKSHRRERILRERKVSKFNASVTREGKAFPFFRKLIFNLSFSDGENGAFAEGKTTPTEKHVFFILHFTHTPTH